MSITQCLLSASQDKKFLKFWWKVTLYQFNAMPNGLALAPRKFTKPLKPVYAKLRADGQASTSFIDDLLLVSYSYHDALINVLGAAGPHKDQGGTEPQPRGARPT